MLTVGLVIFAIAAGSVYGKKYECYIRQRNECNDEQLSDDLPDSVAKLEEACRVVPEYLNCTLNVEEDCDPLGSEAKYLRHTYDKLLTICDGNRTTYKVLSENIQCIAGNVEKTRESCFGRIGRGHDNEGDIYRQTVSRHVENFDSLNGTDLACLQNIYAVTCLSMTFGIFCGEEVEEVIYDIGKDFEYHYKYNCSPEIQAMQEHLRSDFKDALNADEDFVKSIQGPSDSTDQRRR